MKEGERSTGKKKTAFVLSGGGSLGSVQVGMIKALFERGIIPDFFVGTSVGAINAAFICGNPTMDGILSLEQIWLSVREKEIFPSGLLTSILRILRKKITSSHRVVCAGSSKNNYPIRPWGRRKLPVC